jgi:hypothetical protein
MANSRMFGIAMPDGRAVRCTSVTFLNNIPR